MLNIFSAFGLSASAGLNAYLPLLMVALAARFGFFTLQEPWSAMTKWWVIAILGVLTLVEFLVDKIPAVDTVNDVINTLIRPVAGAILFAASANVITEISPAVSIVLGLFVAGGVHAAKTTARPVVTATTAGVGNAFVSLLEDVVSLVMSLLAIVLPVLVMIFVFLLVALFLWWRLRRTQRQSLSPAEAAMIAPRRPSSATDPRLYARRRQRRPRKYKRPQP